MALPVATVLSLPYPPSVNKWWTPVVRYNARTRQHYAEMILSETARQYHESAGWTVLAQRPKQHCWPYRVPVVLTLTITPPERMNKRVGDLDNLLKGIQDVLVSSGVLLDDVLIRELHVYSRLPQEQGEVLVEIVCLVEENP
jgi:Holliday junction resolvase RusA-like endonuclease